MYQLEILTSHLINGVTTLSYDVVYTSRSRGAVLRYRDTFFAGIDSRITTTAF